MIIISYFCPMVYLCAMIPFPYLPPDSCTRGWGSLKKITINLDDSDDALMKR